jgi:hypothetical protein
MLIARASPAHRLVLGSATKMRKTRPPFRGGGGAAAPAAVVIELGVADSRSRRRMMADPPHDETRLGADQLAALAAVIEFGSFHAPPNDCM